MTTFISFSLTALVFLLAIPVTAFFLEVIAAVALRQTDCPGPPSMDSRSRIAVLVPAHNESTGLLSTLADIKLQLRTCDRLVVVADNCVDDTAAVAVAAGAEVVARNDPDRKGKGYALAWGLGHISADPPDIVIIVDADCRLTASTIDQLAAACAMTHRPIQALNLMVSSDESPINSRVAEFAWRVRNFVRPLGLRALNLPCQLMGTGMAFPWDVIRSADLASGLIVEDLKLGLDLAQAGNSPVFYPFATVTSDFPFSVKGVQSQRLRWEQGHVAMILTATPRLISAAIRQANLDLLALAIDMAVPPLSLLGMLVMSIWVITLLATLLGVSSSAAMFVVSASLVEFIGAVFVCWLKFGRDILPPRAVLSIFSYVFGKFPIYRNILLRKSGSEWIRTDRRKI
jgi:cellulose synthase/poly-beta-1,6-N-acetylglucosamine synthase-like glycosyltransferase